MNICIIANVRAVHTQRWAKALAARGHDMTVLSIRSAEIDGVRVMTECIGPVNSANPFWSLLSYLRLLLRARAIVSRLSPDVVNAHYCVTHGVIAALAGLRPRVVNLWGSDIMWDAAVPMPPWRRWPIRLALESADAIVSTSYFMVGEVRRVLKRLPPLHVVPFGVDTEAFRPAPSPDEERNGNALTIGFVKTLGNKYAPDVFIQAAALIARCGGGHRFVMAGGGPLRARCEQLAAELGIADRITFLGPVAHDQVPAVMRSLDILVNCSRVESFGVVICEASATGKAVIATDVGGVRETVIDGTTGLLVPPGDPAALAQAICRLAADPALRADMGRAGRQLVSERYDWNDCVENFERILLGVGRRDRECAF